MLYLPPLTSMLCYVSEIVTVNETVSDYDDLGAYLDLCGSIISILNCSPRSSLTKVFVLVIIESFIVYRNGHEKMVLQVTPSPRARETVTDCTFTKNEDFKVITALTSNTTFPC